MLRVVLSFIFCTFYSLATAQTGGPPLFYAHKPDRDGVDRMTNAVRDIMGQLVCDNQGRRCAPDTPEERARPMIPRSVELRVIDAGMVSGMSDWCGIDSHMHYTAMMAWERAQRRWSEKQLAYIGGLHIAARSAIMGSRQHHICDPNGKAGIANSPMTRVQAIPRRDAIEPSPPD